MPGPIPNDISRQLNRGTGHVADAYREVEERLGGRKGANQVWRRAVRSAFQGMISEARTATPHRTGRLARRIDARPGTGADRKRAFFSVRFGFFGPKPYHQALAVEFGNRNVRESQPLRATWRRNQERLMGDIQRALRDEVRRIGDELARKLAQSSR